MFGCALWRVPNRHFGDTQLELAWAEIQIELVVQARNAGWSNFDYTELVASLVD